MPNKEEIITVFESRLVPYVGKRFSWVKLAEKAEGLSCAEVTLSAQDAIKDLLINEYEKVTIEMVASAIDDRRGMSHEMHR